MNTPTLLDPVQILADERSQLVEGAVLLEDQKIKAFNEEARHIAENESINTTPAPDKIFAPCLVDPHSILEDPLHGYSENLDSLKNRAAHAGYAQIAILPRGKSWKDRPERLLAFAKSDASLALHLWGSYSLEGKDQKLSQHKDLLSSGAIGLAGDDSILPFELLKKGFLLGEMDNYPVLIAPRDKTIQSKGILREGVETLRAGFKPDPYASETLPLKILLELQEQHPEINLRLMNISTGIGVSMIAKSHIKPMASVSWWHLISDSSTIEPTSPGLKVSPSIGNPKDREELIKGLQEGVITGVAVHATPVDQAEAKKPPELRLPGITGHEFVLPCLWQELIVERAWSVEQLWQVLSFGPSKILKTKAEKLTIGSDRWLLFDPKKKWTPCKSYDRFYSRSNKPFKSKELIGKVQDCGITNQENPFD